MGWKDIPPRNRRRQASGRRSSYGKDYRGWTLTCGPAFFVHMHQDRGNYYTTLNGAALGVMNDLGKAKGAAE